jgi:small subunit ribosomal protein S20
LLIERVFRRKTLANIKSQIKRNKQNEKRRLRNRVYRGSARIAVRTARSAMEEGNTAESRTTVLEAISALDRAAEKGVIHKNNAARRKGRLMKRLESIKVDLKSTSVDEPAMENDAAEEKAPKKAAAKKSSKKSA